MSGPNVNKYRMLAGYDDSLYGEIFMFCSVIVVYQFNCFMFICLFIYYFDFSILDVVKQSSRSDSLLSVYDNVILRANSQPI